MPPQNYCGEFDNYAAVMSVSEELLCACTSPHPCSSYLVALTHIHPFLVELLKPLDGPALKKEMTKAKRKRFVSHVLP